MTIRKWTIALLAAAGLGLSSGTVVAAEIELTFSTTYTPTHPYGRADEEWIKRIHEQTDGRVNITAFWGGSLINSREGIDELNAGVADISYIAPIYASSGYDLSRLTPQFFYGYDDALEVLEVYKKLWDEYPQFAEELEGAKVLGYNVGTPMHLMLRDKALNQLADLQGLRIRSAVDFIGALTAHGAEGVTMPMTDTYPSLQRGVLDGVIAPYEALKSLSFAEVVKYYSELPHSRGAYPSRAINANAWAKLPEDIQKVFEDNIDWWTKATFDYAQESEDAGREYGVQHGVQFNAVDPAVIAEYAKAFEPAARETAKQLDAKGIPGTEIHDKIRAALNK
ncbi:TRAP transporter substrate-binding protein [Aquamicrobium zhengzhouense]|uniref:TRAP transporter substrate-binding protein DctP n=1 Tax=Aquamicrobium zhengzhouense TaxID=2781738 RepID=A0ABS0SER2_9HYPH|nr:TRAP transporter substrate-binding protein DctP [Aquamicrobium zhengzhouense]MBI1621785.1 TRAP transporter substrate-binding protein DctP [Aquamicrobium zhengzhouense]